MTAFNWVVEQRSEISLTLLMQIIALQGSRLEELTGDYASVNSARDNASLNSATEAYTVVKCVVQYNQYIPELDGAIMFQSGGDQLY